MSRYKIDFRQEHYEGFWDEPNKDYGSMTYIPAGSITRYFVLDTKTGLRSTEEFMTYPEADAFLKMNYKKTSRKKTKK